MTIDRREFVAGSLAGLGIASVGGVAHAGNGARASVAAAGSSPEALAPTVGPQAARAEVAAGENTEAIDPRSAEFGELLTPIAVGTSVAGTTVMRVEIDGWGRGTAELRTKKGASFHVDVCTTDATLDHTAVAETERYELFVRNGGDGELATEQEVAHAIGALADAIRLNEASAPVAVLTKSEYWARGC